MSRPVGVAVMAYGTPASHDDVEAFYTDVRRGRPPSPEQLADLRRRYAAVGGTSQLAERTAEQVCGIEEALSRRAAGRFLVGYGAKHSSPTIEACVDDLAEKGAGAIVGLVLAPHYSAASVGEYIARARARATEAGLASAFVEDWHTLPALIDLLAERTVAAYASIGATPSSSSVELLVTAHSLPLRVIEAGDGYDARVTETGELVAGRAGAARWRVAWQSAGRTPEPWIGPDILEVVRSLPDEGVEAVVVCPAGFTSDHLEVNYDVDIEAQAAAGAVGLRLVRTASLNADERLCEALAELVARTADGLPAGRNG